MQNSTLTSEVGSWNGTVSAYTRQWQRCSSYPSSVRANSPLGYWRLNETSGTAAVDSVGTNTGSYSGGTPQFGATGALTPSGDGDAAVWFVDNRYMNVPSTPALHPNDQTVELWVKPDFNGTHYLWGTTYQAAPGGNEWGQLAASGQVQYVMGGGRYVLTSKTALAPGNWYHLAFTRTGGSAGAMKLYVNGVLEASGTYAGLQTSTNTKPLRFGAPDDGSVLGLTGSLDEIAFYSTALSATRLKAHADAGVTPGNDPARRASAVHESLR